MSAAEHRKRAEFLLGLANEVTDPTVIEGGWEPTDDPEELSTRRLLMAHGRRDAAEYRIEALVHAVLAMAAAFEEQMSMPAGGAS